MASNNAIVALTRGYSDLNGYYSLIQRNLAISSHIGSQYPLVLFHEGDITAEQQEYIKEQTPELTILFSDISAVWSGGYEGMCRFQTYDIWNLCAGFDNIMRIDEDCIIQSLDADPDELFDLKGNVYLRSVYFAESHSETNATLPKMIEDLTGADRNDFYNDKFVYTNVGIANVQFWLEPEMNKLLDKIANSDEQRANRIGDLPVLGSLLNIFAKGKVGHIQGLTYKHLSHDNIITSNGVD